MDFVTVMNGAVALNVAVRGEGPLILCVHGWPELWYSWRHQIAYFSELGYRVAALDVRGYGGSDKPPAVADYSMGRLAGDVAAIIRHFGGAPAILMGHDWGAPIVWNTALLHPEMVRGVAGLSVPYLPRGGDASFLTASREIYAGRFFYMLYFQAEGVAEAELEADISASLRRIYFAASGDAPRDVWLKPKPASAKFLDGLPDPSVLPAWMGPDDLKVFVDAFQAGGFRGPINRYRSIDNDFAELEAYKGKPVTQPSCFVAGELDLVRHLLPGVDLFANPGAACSDFRGSTIIPKAGHWVQQETPDLVNAALGAFVSQL
jgi:pimeloyl-ACP methyl ester carboxylesterase